jgi:hypothetical protein
MKGLRQRHLRPVHTPAWGEDGRGLSISQRNFALQEREVPTPHRIYHRGMVQQLTPTSRVKVAAFAMVVGIIAVGALTVVLSYHVSRSDRWVAVGAIGAVVQAVGVVAVLVYAAGQLKEARESREERDRPFVLVCFDTTTIDHFIHLEVANLGSTFAKNVTFEFTPPLRAAQEVTGKLDERFWPSALLERGFKTLVPGARIRTVFDFSPDRKQPEIEGQVPETYDVVVRYEGPNGKRWETDYTLDLSYARHVTFIDRKSVHHAVEELKQLRMLVAKIVGPDGLRIRGTAPDGLQPLPDRDSLRRALGLALSQENSATDSPAVDPHP